MENINSEKLCKKISEENNGSVICSFSTGKDSIGTLLQLRKYFKNIYCYYLYNIPKLDFVEKTLNYYEEFFNIKILRLPHPSFYRMMNNMVFQPPERLTPMQKIKGFPRVKYEHIYTAVRTVFELPNGYIGIGVRSCDNLQRRISIKTRGVINYQQKTFFPIWDWNIKKLREEIEKAGVKLSDDYKLFGRSFDGICYSYTKVIKDNYPEDYKKIKKWFPLIDVEILRREYADDYWKEETI